MKATRRTRVAEDEGVRRSSRAVRDEEGRRRAGEGVGADIPFGCLGAGGVGADPGHAVESGATYLPARGMQFEADGTAEFVEGEVDGTDVVAGRGRQRET